jgi:hypothetical protein
MPRAHKSLSRGPGGAPAAEDPGASALVADAEVADLVARLREGLSEPTGASSLLAAVPDRLAAASLEALLGEAGAEAVPAVEHVALTGEEALALPAIHALGSLRAPAAAAALLRLADHLPGKEQKKAARRELARLRSQGISVAVERPDAAVATTPLQPRATAYHALASHIDGSGSRMLWLYADRPLGGAYLLSFVLNDLTGIKDSFVRDSTRKRLALREAEAREQISITWIDLPVDYARWLVHEAATLNAESGTTLPTEYQLWREVVGEPAQPPERPLVYETVSRFEVKMRPELLRDSPRLFEEPELQGWFFSYQEVREYANELRRARESRLVLSSESEEQRQERVVGQAIRELFTPALRRGLQRRLEETGYIFLQSERPLQARLAVAAAVEIADSDPIVLPRHPFVRAIVERSIELVIQALRAGMDPSRLDVGPSGPMD